MRWRFACKTMTRVLYSKSSSELSSCPPRAGRAPPLAADFPTFMMEHFGSVTCGRLAWLTRKVICDMRPGSRGKDGKKREWLGVSVSVLARGCAYVGVGVLVGWCGYVGVVRRGVGVFAGERVFALWCVSGGGAWP